MKSKWKIVFILSVLMIVMTGCNKNETTVSESNDEETQATETTIKAENDESNEEVSIQDESSQPLTYRGDAFLNEDNMSTVLYTFFTVNKEDGLEVLETLPLTECFFEQCVNDFPYLPEDIYETEVTFWAIDENNKCICLVKANDGKIKNRKHYSYAVEMNIVNDQIDSMKIDQIE